MLLTKFSSHKATLLRTEVTLCTHRKLAICGHIKANLLIRLSDPERRKMYDQFGITGDGTQADAAAGAGQGAGGFQGFSGFPGGTRTFRFNMGGGGGSPFTASDPQDIFNKFFGGGGGFSFGDEDDDYKASSMHGGGMPGGFGFGGFGGRAGGMPRQAQHRAPEPEVVLKKFPVSLEDLFHGAKKRLKVTRRRMGTLVEKVLELQLKPGWKAGTKITFTGEGDEKPNGMVQDIQFVLEEKKHPVFTREGDDLKMTIELSFKEALLGWSRTIDTIDGKKLPIARSAPTQPGQTIKYPGQGMPKQKSPHQRGELILEIKVTFPYSLTTEQKETIKNVF